MAYKDRTSWKSFTNQYINTNGQQLITGALLNQALIDLSDSVNWGIAQQATGVTISVTPLVVTFPVPMPSTNYALMVRSYDAQGDPVDYRITDLLAEGFTVTGAVDGSIDWYATHQ